MLGKGVVFAPTRLIKACVCQAWVPRSIPSAEPIGPKPKKQTVSPLIFFSSCTRCAYLVRYSRNSVLYLVAEKAKQLKEEADRFEADPFYVDNSKNRLDISKYLSGNKKDLSLNELGREIPFAAADSAERRAQELKHLALLSQSNANKIVKIFGHAHATSDITVKVQQALTDVTSLLSDRGIEVASEANLDAMHEKLETLQASMQAVRTDVDKVTADVDDIDFSESQDQIAELAQRAQGVDLAQIYPTLEKLENKIAGTDLQLRTYAPLALALPAISAIADDIDSFKHLAPRAEGLLQMEQRMADLERDQQGNRIELAALQSERRERANEHARIPETLRQLEELKRTWEVKATTGATSVLGGARIPELKSLDPADFRTWKTRFVNFADLQKWTESITKKALKLATPDSKIHVPLQLLVPDFDDLSVEDILAKYEKRCCPDSNRDQAIQQQAQLHQGLEEGSQAFIDRAVQLYYRSQYSDSAKDPEDDEQFINRLISLLRDGRLRGPLRRLKLKTITQLRMAIDEETAIIADDPTMRGQVAALAEGGSINKINGFDGQNSNEKLAKDCWFCNGKHSAKDCRKALSFTKMVLKQYGLDPKSAMMPNQTQGQPQGQPQGQAQGQTNRGRGKGKRGRGQRGSSGYRGRGRGGYQGSNGGGGSPQPPPYKIAKLEPDSKN